MAHSSALEHTLAHLARLDLLVRREVLRARLQNGPGADDDFRGLYISDDEVDALLAGSMPVSSLLSPSHSGDAQIATLSAAITAASSRIADFETWSAGCGPGPPLTRLTRLFGLSTVEQETLVICLAAELDLKYERLYAYLQDDVTKKRPTVDLVMRLLCPTIGDRLAARRAFEPGAPLTRWDLATLHDDPGARRPVLLARYLKLDDRIAGYLLGSPDVDARLVPLAVQLPTPSATGLSSAVTIQLERWAAAWRTHATPGTTLLGGGPPAPLLLIHGRYGTGKRAAAAFLAAALGQPLLLLNAEELLHGELPLWQGLKLAEREALLTGAVLCWCQADCLTHAQPENEADGRVLARALAASYVPTIVLTERRWEPVRTLGQRPFVELHLPETTYAERRGLWSVHLSAPPSRNGSRPAGEGAEAAQPLSEVDLNALAGRFRLTPGQIADAVARARSLAWARNPAHGQVCFEDIDAACRAQAQHRLGTLARKIEPHFTWQDIVLPRSQLATLRMIGATIRQRAVVYGDWGFDCKLALGKGVICLFAGPSGTGKTMAAEIIAHDLGLDLYKIDLSAVVNKYIGETEKNLERIFGEAQDSDAILFFDEADALFGKRSEVKDAHDRYANIETAYLLQRTEEYDGLVILASNLKKNVDEAFIRRLHFTVDFPFPEEAERLEIWQRTFPPQAPRADDIDLPFLARKLKIAGGNIRNIILGAAFLAAEDGERIAMRHLIRAAAYEFQKMGKLVVEGDFEHYFDVARS
ncbi:MAG: ATP-binding protein [Anaerolineae bacterium]